MLIEIGIIFVSSAIIYLIGLLVSKEKIVKSILK
jgi:hypothetical protein